MQEFFEGVGTGYSAGVWDTLPVDHPDFRAETRRRNEKAQKKRKAEEMG
jgi:chlorophyllide a reductase subunit Y